MPRQSYITRLVIKLGLAKDEKRAPTVLLAIAVLAVVITFVFWPRSGGGSRTSPAEFITHTHQHVTVC